MDQKQTRRGVLGRISKLLAALTAAPAIYALAEVVEPKNVTVISDLSELITADNAEACGWQVYNQYSGCLRKAYYYYCGAFRYAQCCCVCEGCHQSPCYICG